MRRVPGSRSRPSEELVNVEVELVGIREIAELLGVRRETVDKWRTRELLPEPRWVVSGTPIWLRREVLRWARETGRDVGSGGG